MPRFLVSFGANIGDPLATIQAASVALREELGCPTDQFQLSGYYRTPPVGGPGGQPPFVNAVVAVHTDSTVWQVWDAVRQVEQAFGRERNQRWEARKLDLDILLYDDLRLWTPQLKIPHPRMWMRRFILVPAAEVAGTWIDPVTGQPLRTLRDRLSSLPASLSLITGDRRLGTSILQASARQALADWRCVSHGAAQEPEWSSETGPDFFGNPHARWVELIETTMPDLLGGIPQIESNLAVVLAPPVDRDGAAWEDYHAGLAAGLNLRQRPGVAAWSQPRARYLLAGDDIDWAIHELTAALEAMDCPVERIDA